MKKLQYESIATNNDDPDLHVQCLGGISTRCITRSRSITILLTTVLAASLTNVSTPILATCSIDAGNDPYVACFVVTVFEFVVFMPVALITSRIRRCQFLMDATGQGHAIIVGTSIMVNNLLMMSSSLPNRTPTYLQGVLINVVIPATVILRYLILRKGVSKKRLVCTVIVMVGVFVCSEPHIWGLDGSGMTNSPYKLLWPLCFGLAAIPQALVNIFYERELDRNRTNVVVFLSWCLLYQLVSIILIFWVDLIPSLGMAGTLHTFFAHLTHQFECTFSSDINCGRVVYISWLFVVVDICSNLSNAAIVKYSDGALYCVVACSLVTPLVTLFWTLFGAWPSLHWEPKFTVTTGFTMYGLLILVPAVFMYSYFSAQEDGCVQGEEDTSNETDSYEMTTMSQVDNDKG